MIFTVKLQTLVLNNEQLPVNELIIKLINSSIYFYYYYYINIHLIKFSFTLL